MGVIHKSSYTSGFTKMVTKEGCLSVPNREEDILRYKNKG